VQRATITWLVMTRQLPDTVRVARAGQLVASLVLDVDTGLIRGVAADERQDNALQAAMGSALTQPAANLPAGTPARVLCPIGTAPAVRIALTAVGVKDVPVEEVHPGQEAEDIVDSLVGHLSGRTQPSERPTPEDWQLLHEQTLTFRQAEPWSRWSDEEHLLLTLSTDRGSERCLAIVMGQAGIQHGLALYAGHELSAALQQPGQDEHIPDSIALLLEPATELPGDIAAKAHRYSWPRQDPLTPAFMSLTPEGPEEISRDDAHLLTAALAAVHALDQRGLRAASSSDAVTGSIRLADNDTVNYSIQHQPTPDPTPEPSLRMHLAGNDLITPDTAVTLGHVTWDVLPELRATAHVHRPAPADAPAPTGKEIALLVLSPEPDQGAALAEALADLDPYGASAIDIKEGQHAIIIAGGNGAEVTITLPDRHPALLAWQRRQRQTRGRHLIMVADLDSASGDGSVYGLYECHQPVQARPPAKRTRSKNHKRKRR
jgi:hypothetical protein